MESKIDLLKYTNMVDFAMDIYRQIHGTEDAPEGKCNALNLEEADTNSRSLTRVLFSQT